MIIKIQYPRFTDLEQIPTGRNPTPQSPEVSRKTYSCNWPITSNPRTWNKERTETPPIPNPPSSRAKLQTARHA
ncbi:unnamed protein product [Penicillium camemberti]|uniref:Str. FM013 n=1 Tax=Penicillium camemberti (strain FM 013) TaxID=1429867 RepID=A0A0G4P308_PENC3|nr:unnamed protein product [Penicillium camemberti]